VRKKKNGLRRAVQTKRTKKLLRRHQEGESAIWLKKEGGEWERGGEIATTTKDERYIFFLFVKKKKAVMKERTNTVFQQRKTSLVATSQTPEGNVLSGRKKEKGKPVAKEILGDDRIHGKGPLNIFNKGAFVREYRKAGKWLRRRKFKTVHVGHQEGESRRNVSAG